MYSPAIKRDEKQGVMKTLNSNKATIIFNTVYFSVFASLVLMAIYSRREFHDDNVKFADRMMLAVAFIFFLYLILGFNYAIYYVNPKILQETRQYRQFVGGFLIVVLLTSIFSTVCFERYRQNGDVSNSTSYALASAILGFVYIGIFLIQKYLRKE